MAPVSIDEAKCVLVIGATSGIGRALALAISELPSRPTVIAAGRRQDRLKELEEKQLKTVQLDVSADLETLKETVASLLVKHPNLDAVILASGIQYLHDFNKDVDINQIIREINVNYVAVVSLISIFMPHFLKLSTEGRPSFIIPITSGLALLPAHFVPNYSASKAALRSFTTSLRKQLENTKVNVVEIIPPLVESELHDEQGTTERLSKFWMPLDEYTKLTMDGLRKGDHHVAAGSAAKILERFEKEGLNGPFPV
jgi:short-subunit dehydrogenase involved in D-alanine esterification of teichoic acids